MASAASMRTSFFLSSASRLETSSIASRPNAVAAMKAIFCATASCWPTGLPHCTRSLDHSRAILVDSLATPRQIAGSARRPVLSVVRAILRPWPSLPITFSAGTKTSSSSVTEFSIPRRPMNWLRCSTLTPSLRVVEDEGGDAAAVALGLRHLRHHHDDVGDRAVGRPQLAAVEHVAALGRDGRGAEPRGVRADVGLGEQEGGDVVARHQRQPLLLLLLGAEADERLGDADRLVGGEQRRERGVPGAGEHERLVVVDLREAEAAVLLGHLHAERAELLEAVDDRLGDPRLALDLERVDLTRRGTRAAAPGTPRPCATAAGSSLGWGWMRSSRRLPRKSCLPKLGFSQPCSRALSATCLASFSLIWLATVTPGFEGLERLTRITGNTARRHGASLRHNPNPGDDHASAPTPTCIRLATEHDAAALRRLAALDSARPLTGRVLIGEIDGFARRGAVARDRRARSPTRSSRPTAARLPAHARRRPRGGRARAVAARAHARRGARPAWPRSPAPGSERLTVRSEP